MCLTALTALVFFTSSVPRAETTVGERIPFDAGVLLPATPALKLAGGAEIGVSAKECGACHAENYSEWRDSTHAHAMKDPQYFAELSKPGAPRWLCLNCHAPNQNQRSILIHADTKLVDDPLDVSQIERVPNPSFDREMRSEGVTCATCHVRVQDGNSVVVASRSSGRAPHPVRSDAKALQNVCLRCHDPGPGKITPQFFCWFETAREGKAHGVKQNCVECHMPPVTRPLVGGSPARKTRHHYWTGGGVPKTFDGYDTLLDRDYIPGGVLTASLERGVLNISLENKHAGHHLTSADPERYVWVQTVLVDETGKEYTLDTQRFAQEWDWGSSEPVRPARRLQDSRIPAGQSKSWSVKLPNTIRELRVTAAHVRLAPQNAKHMKGTVIPKAIGELWPDAAATVARLEHVYPFLTFFAEQTYTAESERWSSTPLSELLERSKGLKGTPISDYADLLGP